MLSIPKSVTQPSPSGWETRVEATAWSLCGQGLQGKSGQKNARVGSLGRQRGWLWGFRERWQGEASGGTSHRPKAGRGGCCRAEWGHPRIVGEGNGTGAGQGAERRLLNPESAPWERHTQRPFEVGDLGVAHPQLGHGFRQCSLLSWDKKSLLLFQNTPHPSLPVLPPWASPPSPELAQQLVFPFLPAILASPSSWGRKKEK